MKSVIRTIIPVLPVTAALVFASCSRKPASTYNYSRQSAENKSLVTYESEYIKGYEGKHVIIDYYFIPVIKRINRYAKKFNVELQVTSSFRTPEQQDGLSGTVVKPACMSNHLAGHAIDINIVYEGQWYNSTLMRKNNLRNLPYNVRAFINSLRRDKGIRWGGDFSIEDPVHYDDHLNKNKNQWLKRYYVCQNKYKDYIRKR
ncbi:MAG: M15 family metallopeptidase [Victivallales bacterium]|nr:M15 family metallopeptidase [Victivallales bacterium]